MPLTFYFDFALNLSAGRKSGGETDPKKGSRVNKQTVQSFVNSIADRVFTPAGLDRFRGQADKTGGEGGIRTPDTR